MICPALKQYLYRDRQLIWSRGRASPMSSRSTPTGFPELFGFDPVGGHEGRQGIRDRGERLRLRRRPRASVRVRPAGERLRACIPPTPRPRNSACPSVPARPLGGVHAVRPTVGRSCSTGSRSTSRRSSSSARTTLGRGSRRLIAMAWKHPNVYIATSGHAPKYWDPRLVQFLNARRGIGKVHVGHRLPADPARREPAPGRCTRPQAGGQGERCCAARP